ncbi:MAG: 50S ribosomal protein L11 methyltransferase [Pseudomonadota bacterium]
MSSWSALTTLPGKAPAEALGASIETLDPAPMGVGVFEMEDGSGLWEIGGYFNESPDPIKLDLLAAVHGARPFAVSEIPDKDWVAEVRRELAPIAAGRFFLYGSHDADKVPDGAVGLLIEAAMAFGTGHHGTTKGCLLELESLLQKGLQAESVLDLGCGTAVLAMAAAKIWPGQFWASDIDEVATQTATANIGVNDLAGRISVVTAAGLDHPELKAAAPYDLIFANILKGPLIELAQDIGAATANGGQVILSGLLVHQQKDVEKAFKNQQFVARHYTQLGDWVAITMQKMA